MFNLARYLVGGALAWIAFPVEALLAYLVLLAVALLTDSAVGSPLAGPLFTLVAAAVGAAAVPVVLLPSVVIAERVVRDRGDLMRYLIAVLGMLLLVAGCALPVGLAVSQSAWLSTALPMGTLVVWAGGLLALSTLPLLVFCAVVFGAKRVTQLARLI